MAVTYLKRIDGATNSIVQMDVSDLTAVALASGYVAAQAVNINAVNDGGWTWEPNDMILLSASDGVSWCGINSLFSSLILIDSSAPGLVLQYANFIVTDAQFDAMSVTPVLVLPAAGANTLVLPQSIGMELIYGSAPFAGGGPVGFQYGNTAALGGIAATNEEAAADFTVTANNLYNFVISSGNGSNMPIASVANAGIYISNTTAPFTGGTGSIFAGSLAYRTITVV